MSLWKGADLANNAPVFQISHSNTADGNAAYGNVSSLGASHVGGVFAVNDIEMANSGGERNRVPHSGWSIRRAGRGPVVSIAVTTPGQNYAPTDLVRVSNGTVNASANVTVNGSGNLTAITVLSGGGGFINTSAINVAFTNSSGGTANGTGGAVTVTLGGRAGRIHYEVLVAGSITSNGTSDDAYFPQ